MKTAISIPDPIFQAAEDLSKRLGITRSELYAKAVAEFTDYHQSQNITQQLDEIYAEESSQLDIELTAMQSQSVSEERW